MTIICLSGWKRSGKDTCANYLIDKHNATRVALADPLKDMVAKEFNIDRVWLDDPKLKETPLFSLPVEPKDDFSCMIAEFMYKEFRTIDGIQPMGFCYEDLVFKGHLPRTEECMWPKAVLYWTPRALAILKGSTNRSAKSDFWIERAFDTMRGRLDNEVFVVTDLRYKSEVEQFKREFGERALFIRINRHKESISNDPSERDLDSHRFDHYVDNTGSLEDTYKQIEGILSTI